MTRARWSRCIYYRGDHTEKFLQQYLSEPQRRMLLIAGAGFDPRSTTVAKHIVQHATGRIRGYFLREERPHPGPTLTSRAVLNEKELCRLVPDCTVSQLDIFTTDNAVVGGRKAVGLVDDIDLDDLTDIFVDFSALSIGVAFPIIKYLFVKVQQQKLNLHLVVADEPETDAGIRSTVTDMADAVHGFKGGWGLDANSRAAVLWMPQLVWDKRPVLEKIRERIRPHAFCPILPFPTDDPRLPDRLIEHYAEGFENAWRVDSRDIVYASQRDPLDLYRTILKMDDYRKRIFENIGGSQIILSPVGSKALAAGALMAALERDFTIMYVEALGYSVDFDRLDEVRNNSSAQLMHIWLSGEAYPPLDDKEADK